MNHKQLKRWRKKEKLTQPEAAKLFDVSCSQYKRWELQQAPVPFLVAENIRLMREVEIMREDDPALA